MLQRALERVPSHKHVMHIYRTVQYKKCFADVRWLSEEDNTGAVTANLNISRERDKKAN